MAFYQVTAQDHRTRSTRTLDVSAKDADDAAVTAFEHGLIEGKVDPLTDRDLLHRAFGFSQEFSVLVPHRRRVRATRQRALHRARRDHAIRRCPGSHPPRLVALDTRRIRHRVLHRRETGARAGAS